MAGHAEVALTRRGEKATTQSREDSAPSMFRVASDFLTDAPE